MTHMHNLAKAWSNKGKLLTQNTLKTEGFGADRCANLRPLITLKPPVRGLFYLSAYHVGQVSIPPCWTYSCIICCFERVRKHGLLLTRSLALCALLLYYRERKPASRRNRTRRGRSVPILCIICSFTLVGLGYVAFLHGKVRPGQAHEGASRRQFSLASFLGKPTFCTWTW
jgi:hypothetical protein